MKLAKINNSLRQVFQTPLGEILSAELKIESWPSSVRLNFPKIPYRLFLLVCKWQTEIAMKHGCESATSLFLIDNEWVAIPFFQKNTQGSMTIDTEFEKDPRNQALLNEYTDKSMFHATIHNHVKMGASQSGTDAADEKGLYGPHITIGNLDQKKMSFHGRLSMILEGKHHFIPLRFTDIIDVPLPPGAAEGELLKAEELFLSINRDAVESYPEEWKERFDLEEKKNFLPTHIPTMGKQNYGYLMGLEENEGPWEKSKRERDSTPEWVNILLEKAPITSLQSFICYIDRLPKYQKESIVKNKLKKGITYKDLYDEQVILAREFAR